MNEIASNNLRTRKKKVVQDPMGTKLKRLNTTITYGKYGGLSHNRYNGKNPSVA